VFAVAVTGFATGDVTLSGTAGATTAAVTGSGTTYSVSGVRHDVGRHRDRVDRRRGLRVGRDRASLNVASTSSDHTVTVSALTVTVEQAAGQADPAGTSGPILFTATFSQAVTGFATGDVTLSGTAGATTAVVSGSGPYTSHRVRHDRLRHRDRLDRLPASAPRPAPASRTRRRRRAITRSPSTRSAP
jgi:hypothetical protein